MSYIPQEVMSIILNHRTKLMKKEKEKRRDEKCCKILSEELINNFEPCDNCNNDDIDLFEISTCCNGEEADKNDENYLGWGSSHCCKCDCGTQCWYIDRDFDCHWSDMF